jgi:hypothetical protein
MPPSAPTTRGAAAVFGAVLGDAATLGLHWVYAQPAIASAVASTPTRPEFLFPHATSYHKLRGPGDVSMYGEGALVAAESLAAKKGVFSGPHLRTAFLAAFGPCGSFSGYADKTTKRVVHNYLTVQAAVEPQLYPTAAVLPAVRAAMFPRFASLAEDCAPDALVDACVAACTASVPDADSASLDWVRTAAAAWGKLLSDPSVGADDDQSNFLGKLVPVAARYAGRKDFAAVVEQSIRATQNHDDAVAWGLPAARMVEAAVLGKAMTGREAVEAALPHFSPAQRAVVDQALEAAAAAAAAAKAGAAEEDPFVVTARIGAACQASRTVPVSIYFLARDGGNPTYADALRGNMLAGGESCARACLIGAVLGAVKAGKGEGEGGCPEAWVAQLAGKARERLEAVGGVFAAE